MRSCTPGLVHRWSFYVWPGDGDPPEEGEIAVHADTGSCYLVLSVKPSRRKGTGWHTMQVEGLGAGAAEYGAEGTFGYKRLTHSDYEAIRMIEEDQRLEAF